MDIKSSTGIQNTIARVVCTFVFTLFTFFYLYYYQADVLTVMQHVFSKGQTHYNHFIGAVLITVVLLMLQTGVAKMLGKLKMAWALTFVPSAFCLSWLTDVRLSPDDWHLEFGVWAYVLPFALVAYVLAVWGSYASGLSDALRKTMSGSARSIWVNLLVVLLSILLVCFSGNNDKVYHARIHAEQCIMDGDNNGALVALRGCGSGDSNVTMLTAYALAREHKLPEGLFEYQLKGGSRAMMPDGRAVKFEMLPDSSFYSFLGGWYVQRMSTMKYLDYQRRHRRMNRTAIDYLLCACLMDRNLDAFAANITKYYSVADTVALPKHYREALTLYTHMRSAPRVIYKNSVVEADFQDYQKLEKSISGECERKTALRETYGNTYWYYYQYKE